MLNERSIGWFLNEHEEQGLFPPNSYIEDIKDDNWLLDLKKHFNNILFTYYYDRIIFYDENKFPYDQPITTYNNLRHQIGYILLSKKYTYEGLWTSTQLEYNPLYNVDGTTITNRTLKQTGTDTNARTGSDTTSNSGSDVTTGQKTTYDTSFLDSDKSTLEHGLESETTYGSNNVETRNLQDQETITERRYGNIGVTKSTDLIDSQRETVKFDVLKYIVHDIVNQISYGIY